MTPQVSPAATLVIGVLCAALQGLTLLVLTFMHSRISSLEDTCRNRTRRC